MNRRQVVILGVVIVAVVCVGLTFVMAGVLNQFSETPTMSNALPTAEAQLSASIGRPTVTPIPRWWEIKGPSGIQKDIDWYISTWQTPKPAEIDGGFSVHTDLAGYFDKAYLVREAEQGEFTTIPLQLTQGKILTNYWMFDVAGLRRANYQIVVELHAFGTTLVKKGEWFSVP